MKIGLVCDSLGKSHAGFSRYEKTIIQWFLNEANHELFIFLPKTDYKLNFKNHEKAHWILWPKGFYSYFDKVKIIKKINSKYSLNCIHYLENIFWTKIKGVKTILTLHDISPLMLPKLNFMKFYLRWWYQFNIKHALSLCDQIITVSNHSKQDITNFFQMQQTNSIKVIHNFIQTTNFDYSEITSLKDKSFIFIPCTYQKRKNISNMIKAFDQFTKNNNKPDCLAISGQKNHENNSVYHELKKLIENLNLEKKIHLLNGVTDHEMNWLYKNALITYYVTYYEAFGYPIIESLIQGTPVLAGNTGSTQEIGKNYCFYCDPYQIKSIEKAIKQALDIIPKWNSQKAKDYVKVHFDKNKIIREITNLYENL